MSRSFGGRSLTTSPPIEMSPEVTSSRPAIMRSVVDLPQPDGPTSTTNSLSGMSRLMLRTTSTLSKRLTTLRNATSAIANLSIPGTLTLGRAGGQAGDVIVHQERIDHERRRRGNQRAGHQHAPLIDIAADEARHRADSQHLLVGRIQKR